jgi:hypothetical protein
MPGELDKWRPFRQQIAFGIAIWGITAGIAMLVLDRTAGAILVSCLLLLSAATSLTSFAPLELRQKYLLMWGAVALLSIALVIAVLR